MGTRRGWLGAAVALVVVGCGPREPAELEGGPDPVAPSEAPDLGQAELAATTTTRTLTAYADTMADATQPDTGFPSAQTLYADASPRRQPYLRFSLSGVDGVITSAKLRVYVVDGSKDGPAVYGVRPDWSVSSLTWNKAPAVLTRKLADVGAVSAGTWVEYDVSSWVKANFYDYAFTLVSTTSDGTGIEANDAPGSNNPRLVLTVQDCPGPETVVVSPSFDTWVSQAEPTRRNADSQALTSDGDPESEAYLSFDVATGGRTLTGARLRFFATGGTGNAPAVHATTNWSGGDFDWTGRPAVDATPLADKGSASSDTWVEYDVRAAITGDGRYGFALRPQSTDGMTVTSSEGAALHRPQLVLSYTASTCAYRGLSRVGGTVAGARHVSAGGEERVASTAAAADGGWVALGSYVSNGSANPPSFGGGPLPGIQGFAVTRYREDGSVAWSVGHAGQFLPAELAVAPTGQVLVAGRYYGAPDLGTGPLPQAAGARLFVARLTPDGMTEWVRTFASTDGSGQPGMLETTGLTTDPGGAPIVAGRFSGEVDFGGGPLRSDGSGSQGALALYLVKFAADGSHAWSRTFAASDALPQLEVAADSAGSLYLSGSAPGGTELAPSGSGPTPFVARLTAEGERVWTRAWAGANGATVAVVPYGGDVFFSGTFTGAFTFAGTTYTQVPTDYSGSPDDLFLGRLTGEGTDVWLRHVGSPHGDSAHGLTVTRTGTVVLWAQTSGPVSFGGGTLRGGPLYAGYSTGGTHRWSRHLPLPALPTALTTGELLLGATLQDTTRVDGVSYSPFAWHGTSVTSDAFFLRLRP
ncbi:DNRLRE domain-containing protein [Corallococcus exercitus]|uniref:CBM96 family carbohydrate-binding protein n=1 Tax=Corallococcus exercitus TaxID=2316736 RepID=UPI0035D43B1F